MTPTEEKVLAPYTRLNPVKLAGKTVTNTYYDEYSFIIVAGFKYAKIVVYTGWAEGRLETEALTATDLLNMKLIDKPTWEQILAERREKQKVRRKSDEELAIRRLVKTHGADKIRKLIGEVE